MSEVRDTVRMSLQLTAADVRDLAFMRQSDEYRRVLQEMTGTDIDADASEASYLHAVLEAGLTALRERAEEAGYAAMAAQQQDTTAERQRVARRRIPDWANE
jgi:hypothetical protein